MQKLIMYKYDQLQQQLQICICLLILLMSASKKNACSIKTEFSYQIS